MLPAHPQNPRTIALEVLWAVESQEAFSHIALDSELRRFTLDARDRALATCIVYGTLAWQRRLDEELSAVLRGDLHRDTEPMVRVALRAALFQLRHLDRVPAHAVLHETVNEIKRRRGPKMGGLVNAVLRRLAPPNPPPPSSLPADASPAARLAWTYSLPDALAAQALDRFGPEGAERWAAAMNTPPPLVIRANTRFTSLADLTKTLDASPGLWAPAALRLQHGLDARIRAAMEKGLCTVQDEGSQLVTLFAGPLPLHGSIWDACAGQGGKTAHLTDLLASAQKSQPSAPAAPKPTTTLWATDLYPKKLRRLERSPLAQGVSLRVETADARTWTSPQTFDLVLLDAPCSGLGLMRRHPETRWRRPQDIAALAVLQAELLDATSRAVAPGGLLLYAVCTTTVEETSGQIAAFLARHPDFVLDPPPADNDTDGIQWAALTDAQGCLSLSPSPHDTDGFFAARLRRSPSPTP